MPAWVTAWGHPSPYPLPQGEGVLFPLHANPPPLAGGGRGRGLHR